MKQSSSQASRSRLLALAMFIIPLNVLMIAPVLYNSLLTNITSKDWLAHEDTRRAIPGARPYISCLGRSKCANNIWDSKLFNPKNRYGQKKHQKNASSCACHSVTFRPCIAEESHTQKNKHTCSVLSVHNLIIWCVLAESILQIQSNSWFTCAQLLACWPVGLWWFGNGVFRLNSCVQHRMRKHP